MAALQLPAALVQQDPGEPGFKILRLPQLARTPQALIYRLVQSVQRHGFTAQIAVRRPVQLRPQGFRLPGVGLLINGSSPSLWVFLSIRQFSRAFSFAKAKNSPPQKARQGIIQMSVWDFRP